MNTTVKTADSNMDGNHQRIIKAAVRGLLTELFQNSDAETGKQAKTKLPEILADIRASWAKNTARAPKLFSSASTFALRAVGGKKTDQCLKGKLWGYRDGGFDRWLPAKQLDAAEGPIEVLTLEKDWTFTEGAVSALNVSPDTSLPELAKLLIGRGYTMTLTQIEEMVEATERGEKTDLRTDGWGNFAFVETGNPDNPVAVAIVHRIGGLRPWFAGVRELSDGHRWRAGARLLVRNLDAPLKLGL